MNLMVFYLVVLVLFLQGHKLTAQDYKWDDRFDQLGTDGPIYAVAYHNNNVYVGGSFSKAGNVSANNIARWDGTSWHPLGGGLTSDAILAAVLDIVIAPNGDIVAGGQFNRADFDIVNNIAVWDGAKWLRIFSDGQIGVNNTVRALAYHNNELYAGGLFSKAGNLSVNGIAKWNGKSWERLGESSSNNGVTGGSVYAMTSDQKFLYVGGDFRMAGNNSANRIALWHDGENAWSSLQNGVNGAVYAVATNGSGELFVGGDFTLAHPVFASNVARWDGQNWQSLGGNLNNGVNAPVQSLAFGFGYLIVGGEFTTAGTTHANHFVIWNGSNWMNMGGGVTGNVFDIVYDGMNSVYVGGQFTEAGNIPSKNFAIWHRTTNTVVSSFPDEINSFALYPNYPNPFNSSTKIMFYLPVSSHVVVKVLNVLGKEITIIRNGFFSRGMHTVVWKSEELNSGTYICQVQSGNHILTQKLLLLK